MKLKQIYVLTNPATAGLAFSAGKVMAALPPKKGDKGFFVLLENGTIRFVTSVRINGKGISRVLQEVGYSLAGPDHEDALKLADGADVREGTKLVESKGMEHAASLQATLAGKRCTYVPFDPAKPACDVIVDSDLRLVSTMVDMQAGISFGLVRIEKAIPSVGSSIPPGKGWLVEEDVDASKLPRWSAHGDLVEHAVYTICNHGFGQLEGPSNMVFDIDAPEDAQFPRGVLRIRLVNGDLLVVGADALDTLQVVYHRAGEVVYQREGLEGLSLGAAIGSIAAVLVRVAEMDAQPTKRART